MGAPQQGLLMIGTTGGGPVSGPANVLAAQVLDWQKEESASDVGVNPDFLEVEVFS